MPQKDQPPAFFEPTIWSTIIKAQAGDDATRAAALERLLGRYRSPILRHIQQCRQCPTEQAEDLTQEFILQCLRLDFLNNVSPSKGRFRTFLKTCIRNFLRDRYAWEDASKRKPDQPLLSLDETDVEGRRLFDPAASSQPPGSALDRDWALQVLDLAMGALGQECRAKGRGELFAALEGQLGRMPDENATAELGSRLNLDKSSVRVAMHRLRTRLGELIREEIRQTVGSEGDWREELKYLIELLGK